LINYFYWILTKNTPEGLSIIVLSALSAMILGIAEVISPKGSDNVIVPILAGLLVWLPTYY
jgi:dolichol kinase